MHALEKLAKESGVTHLELDATLTAELFYQKLGYKAIKRIEREFSEGITMDAIFMTKQL
ncbi:MAG: hypothetical protein AB8B95_09825 [Pseudohongiellaceae bacterium]